MFWEEYIAEDHSTPQTPFFQTHPAVRLFIGICIGIAAGLASGWSETAFITALGILTTASFMVARLSGKVSGGRTVAYWLGAVAIGVFISFNAGETALRAPEKILPEMKGMVSGRVQSILRSDSASLRCIVAGTADAVPLPRLTDVRVLLRISQLTERESALTVGSKIVATVNLRVPQPPTLPGEFDESLYCRSLEAIFTASARAENVAIIGQEYGIRAWSYKAAAAISDVIARLFPADIAPLMNALLLGDKTHVPQNVLQTFALTGTAHVIAVSGMHVGVLIALIWIPVAFLPNKWLRFTVMVIAILGFVLLTGLQPSAIRAAVMAIVMLGARALERRSTVLNSVCFTAIVMLLADASLLFSTGFQMSLAAVIGLGIFLQPFRRFFRTVLHMKSGLTGFIGDSLAVSFAASSVVSVLVAVYFGMFSVMSPAANLVIVPLTNAAMIFGFLGVICYPVSVGFASIFAAAAQGCIEASLWLNEVLSRQNFAVLQSSMALPTAIATVCGITYVVYATSLRTAAFRCAVIAVVCSLAYPLFSHSAAPSPLVAPRRDVIAVVLPPAVGKRYVLLCDRKSHQEPRGDFGLETYLAGLPDSLRIVYRGNISEWIAVQIRNQHPAAIFQMNEPVRMTLDSLIGTTAVQMNMLR